MANLLTQKAQLEHALKANNLDKVVRDALQKQLNDIIKKVNKQSGRKAILTDGEIIAGSVAIQVQHPGGVTYVGHRYFRDELSIHQPRTYERTICAISPKGDGVCFGDTCYNGRHNYHGLGDLFCTNQGALDYIITHAKQELASSERDLSAYTKRHELVNQFVTEIEVMTPDQIQPINK